MPEPSYCSAVALHQPDPTPAFPEELISPGQPRANEARVAGIQHQPVGAASAGRALAVCPALRPGEPLRGAAWLQQGCQSQALLLPANQGIYI